MRFSPAARAVSPALLLALVAVAIVPAASTHAPVPVDAVDGSCDGALDATGEATYRDASGGDEVYCVVSEVTADPGTTSNDCASTAYVLSRHRWTWPLSFKVDLRGSGLPEADAVAAFARAGETWDAVAERDVFGTATAGGDGSRAGTKDGVSQVGFKSLGTTGTLGRTTTWFRSDGTAFETDAIYNTEYAWSLTGASGKADLQSVAAHEIGHSLGLDHPAASSATSCLTMYPSTRMGSTATRTLGTGDILGIQKLYGAAQAEPAPAPEPEPQQPLPPFTTTFAPKAGNDWWVEVRVDANRPLASVTATVAGGSPVALSKMSWGTWAKSFHVPSGSVVTFQATATDGASATSGRYLWPTATPAPSFAATFTKHAGNAWWVEMRVDANQPLAGVTASVDGAAPVALAKTNWGTWAKSFYVPSGSRIVFTATATDGQRAVSPSFTW